MSPNRRLIGRSSLAAARAGTRKSRLLCRKLQYFAHLSRASNGPRVAGYPWRTHGLLGNPLEIVAPDFNGAEAPRHIEATNECIEDVAGIAARFGHGNGDLGLSIRIHELAHHQDDPRRSEALHLVGYCLGS